MSLNKKVVSLLKRKKLKLAIAESCTGGMLSNSITSINGASKVFTMGLVTYSNQAKINILKVPKKIIQKSGAVSVKCCLYMVNNLSKIMLYLIYYFFAFDFSSYNKIFVPLGHQIKHCVFVLFLHLNNAP